MTFDLIQWSFSSLRRVVMSPESEGSNDFFYVLDESMRLLFVDDDPILREFAIVHLSTEAASIEAAEDGLCALQALQRSRFDLMLLDLEMPNMDGFEVLRRVRADPRLASLPIMVVTGREDVRAIDRAYQAGATSFVIKPLNWRLLSYQIRYVLRAARAESRLRDPRALSQAS